ncbi:MAG: SPFH/Band 7/PHB domain protein [Methanobacteriota archaeon]|nr:MAG: SPFH/Band 7/PHB domain protein [Euryarchaeota archaeon]
MGGILGLFDLGSVTAFQGVDVVGAAVGAFIFLIFVLIFLFATLKVVKEYERIVNFRLGKAQAEKGPGIVVVIPGIDKPVRVDLRERFLTIPHQTCITKDNAPVDVDFIVYFKVASAADSVIRVNNFEGAAMGIATTTLRAVVGDIILDEVLSKREEINAILRTKLDEVTTRWGVKVTNVEIREILPPKNVTDAMILQMSAERSRRAVVIEADGRKTATVTIAEGDKQSAVLRAEGARQAAILSAEGYAQALSTIFGAAKGVDEKTLLLQYLDALKSLGASPSTKFILPLELTQLIKPLRNMLTAAEGGAAKADDL